MSGSDEIIAGLPEALRDSNRPIVIYQAPPPRVDPVTNSFGLLAWLTLLSLCLALVVFCFWRVWNPAFDPAGFSPIYFEGRPVGLAKQIEERRRINAQADGLIEFLDRVRADTRDRRRTNAAHPLLTGRGGIDALREEWDGMCRGIREGVYDRRIGQLDLAIDDLRRRRALGGDGAALAQLDAELVNLTRQRDAELEKRRTDSDPTLRCTPAVLAPQCPDDSKDPWCNPKTALPGEFVEDAVMVRP